MERNTPSSSSSERNPSPDQRTLNAREEKGNKTVGEGRETTEASHAIGSDGREVDVPQLKNFRPLPGVLYFLSYGTRADLMLYTVGLLGALGCGLPFAAIDLLYGHWTSGLVPRTYTATPNDIRSVSSFVAEMMIAVAICMWIFSSIFFYCFGLASSRVSARIRRAYLSSILNMPAAYFETIGSGEVASRMVRDIGLVQVGVGERLGFLMWSASSFVTGIIVAFYSAPKVAGVIFSIVPFSAILFYGSGAFSSRATDRMSKSEGSASSFLEQILSSIRIVKVFQAGDALTRVYDRHLERIESDGRYVAVAKGVAFAASYFGIFTSYALSFWYGGGRVANNGLDVGKLVTCFFSMFNAMFAIVNILPHITSMYEALIAQNRIRAEIERVSAIDPRDPRGISDLGASGGSSEKGRGGLEIELRNVTFSFPSRPTRKALDNVSILIPAGEVVALVGASGSGKSTMTSLLLRQYDVPDPNSHTNNIFIGGHPVSSVRISHLRDQIAICAQDPVLFAASILENVAVGLTGTPNELRLDKSNLEVVRGLCQEALRKAQALTFVEKLPQGMDSVISGGKTGVLSGGQKQRIAIARALVRRPRVLIMDEGTSALDSQTEARVQQAITEEQKLHGMTVILIAHRLSTVRYAHKIVVLSNGKKLEEGSHDDLLSYNGAYARMIRLHHGVVPGDDTEFQPSTTAPSSTYNPTPADLKAAVSTNYNSAPPTSTHPAGLPTAINNNELTGIRSRPGPGTHEYSMTITNAEEAKASVEAAEKETSEATKKARWRRFFAYVLEQKWWIFSGGIASILIGCSFPVSGVLTGVVVHSLSNPDGDAVARESSRWALWFFVVALLNLVFCVVEGWFLENGAQKITRKMRRDGTEAILQQEVAWFEGEDNGAGGLTAAVGTHPSQVAGALGLVLGRLLVSIVNILGSIGVGFFYSWNLALVGLAPCLILIPAGYFEIRYLEKFETEGEKPLGRATSYATDVVDASKTIASFGRESRVVAEFDKMQQPNVKKHARLLLMGSIWFGLGQAMIPVIVALVFWYGGHELSRGSIGITQLYASFEAVIIGAFSASRLFSYVGDISRATHSFSAFNTWIERRPLVAKIEGRRLLGEKAASNKQGASIVFKDVELIYPSRPRPAINGLNLAIAPGETIAFCGPSGGGKSSILALLARFYEPSRGTISVNGEDIRACDSIEDHYSKLALVSQDATLYEGTVAFNLTLGLTRQVPEDELRQACIDANCMDFILALDGGFDAEIGLKGLSLSGGQRQRLCIARALLRDAQILLLDEATSALDNESEALVQAALDRASVGRTTITIAHRLSTIRGADRIIVVEDGTIVESGSHEELLKKNGRYVELVEAQL